MKRLLLLLIILLCPLAIAQGQYAYYEPCTCSQAQAAYARAQRARADAYAYQRAQAEAYQRWQAETYQRAQAYQRAWAEGYQRQQAAAYARAQAYQRARAEAYMQSQAQAGRATQPQRQAFLLPAVIVGGRVVMGVGRVVATTAAGQAVRQYFRSPERRREAAEFGYDVVKTVTDIRDRPEPRERDRQLERAAVRSVPSESPGLRSQLGEQPRIERRDLDRFAGYGSKGLNDRIGSGQKSGNTPSRSKEIKDWQPRG